MRYRPILLVFACVTLAHSQHTPPDKYILSKFADHDLVFVGEQTHGARENLVFLQNLIPQLYQAGIQDLGFEMSWSEDQDQIDRLINAPTYDNDKALELLFRWDPQIGFTFQEYADVYRAAWKLNHSLPKGVPRFRIVATDLRPDWSFLKPGEEIVARPGRWKAWWGSNQIARNVWMYHIIQTEFTKRGRKALLFNGAGHTRLTVERDAREETGLRFSAAYQARKRLGARVTSIELCTNPASPVGFQELGGYDVRIGELGKRPLPEKIAQAIVLDHPATTFADYYSEGIAQIALKTTPATPVLDFITEARVRAVKWAGILPDVPEITAESIKGRLAKFSEMMRGAAH